LGLRWQTPATPFPVRNGAKINELIPHRVRGAA
jgi:hypothetical protein